MSGPGNVNNKEVDKASPTGKDKAKPFNKKAMCRKFHLYLRDKKGIDFIDLKTVENWYDKHVTPDQDVSLSDMKALIGKRYGWWHTFWNPSKEQYVVKFTDKAWDAFMGNRDKKLNAQDVIRGYEEEAGVDKKGKKIMKKVHTLDALMRKLDHANFLATKQGKSLWGLLESERILWVNNQDTAEAGRIYLLKLVTKRINNDTTIKGSKKKTVEQKRTDLINKAKELIKKDNFEELLGGKDMKGYKFIDFNMINDSEYVQDLIGSYGRLKSIKTKNAMDDLYTSVALSSLFGARYSIEMIYKAQQAFFDQGAYENIEDVVQKIGKLKVEIKEYDKKIENEKKCDKPHNKKEEELRRLREERNIKEKELKLTKKFYEFGFHFTHTRGTDYMKAIEDDKYRIKAEHKDDLKALTVREWVHLFQDPEKIMSYLERRPPKDKEKKAKPKKEVTMK